MDPVAALVSAVLSATFGTCLGTYLGFRLGLSRDGLLRRREFRARIRELALQAGGCHPGRLWQFHREVAGEFQRLRLGVLEDVPCWKQRRFRQRCAEFSGMGQAELEPGEEGQGAAVYQQRRTALVALLEAIAKVG